MKSNVMISQNQNNDAEVDLIPRFDKFRDTFGPRMGSDVATKMTYLPTGELVHVGGYCNVTFLSIRGSRLFPADSFDWMLGWMQQYAPADLLAVDIVKNDLLK